MASFALAMILVLQGRAKTLPKSKKAPTDKAFQSMLSKRRTEFKRLNAKLSNGTITVEQWADGFEAILLEGHTQAAFMGRLLAIQKGDTLAPIDLARGQAAADLELDFARRFRDALLEQDPRYWDAELKRWKADKIEARQLSYCGKMRGTANQAFIEESPKKAEITWDLGAVEDHCDECPDYAAMSPWKRDELPTWPGDNDTPCKFNCECWISIDGIDGFKPFRF